jgi:hypothetical protein
MDKTHRPLLLVLRYGIGGVMVVAGIILLITNSGGFGVDGFALGVGAGLSLIMLNFLYRLGVSGDHEREQEEDARTYLERHGYWPDEAGKHRPTARVREFVPIDEDDRAPVHH